MKIKDKIRQIINDNYMYEFCGMNFQLFKSDLIQIFQNDENEKPIFEIYLNDVDNIPNKYLDLEYKKEILIKLHDKFWVNRRHSFAVRFILNSDDKIEKPISMKIKYI